jgi:glucokinase
VHRPRSRTLALASEITGRLQGPSGASIVGSNVDGDQPTSYAKLEPVSHRCVVGIDLGGTNVRACAYYEDGSEAGPKVQEPSHAQSGTEAIFDAISRVALAAISGAKDRPTSIGLSLPGHIDDAAGMVRWAPNLGEMVDGVFHYWADVDVRTPLEKRIGLPVRMENDANLAALGEYRYGSGRNNARCLVLLTLGTGIGGGVIMSPHAVSGDARGPLMLLGGNKGGAELGHVIVQHGGLNPNSGEFGSIEGYCQRDAIILRAVTRLRRGRKSIINDLVGGDLAHVTPHTISEAADQGDELAIEVWQEIGTYLGVGIGSFVNIFAPDIFAIGGQIAKAGKWLLEPAFKAAQNSAVPTLFRDTRIVLAEKLDDAGMLGAAALAMGSAD